MAQSIPLSQEMGSLCYLGYLPAFFPGAEQCPPGSIGAKPDDF